MWTQIQGSGAGDVRNLVLLNDEHPGFHDRRYRARRDEIARIALAYQEGEVVPHAPYTEAEHEVWRSVQGLLHPLHEQRVCRELRDANTHFPLDPERIPQLRAVNAQLQSATGFRMEPVMGLVRARTFLSALGREVFLSTQYIRHHSRPLYTPEPDIIHELIGHAASLAHPRLAQVNTCIGRAAASANDSELLRLERVYWYSLEFGLVEEEGKLKALGAGLLSSAGELKQIESGPELRAWDLGAIAETPYDPTDMQPQLYVAPSFGRLIGDIEDWVESGAWKRGHRLIAVAVG
jgi:phenylalanine-4-hydroxylase